MTTKDTATPKDRGRLPPRFVIRAAWAIHRGMYRLLGRKRALRPPTDTTWGMLGLTTIGRKSGRERLAILGYYEDGPNFVTMAMNGWGAPEPAWWLNLQAQPETTIELHDGRNVAVRGRAASADERQRLWDGWRRYDGANLDGWASRRPHETAVVILEPIDP